METTAAASVTHCSSVSFGTALLKLGMSSGGAAYRRARIGIVGGSKKNGRALEHRRPARPPTKEQVADCRAAYDDLDAETKSTIEGLAAEHSLWTSRRKAGLEEISEDLVRGLPPVIQPLVRVIPRSGRKAFYVGAHAGQVYGMPHREGQALLQRLTGFATQPEYVYSHKWTVGDIVIWDNRAVLHRAGKFDGATEYRRDMRRTTVDEFQPSWARLG